MASAARRHSDAHIEDSPIARSSAIKQSDRCCCSIECQKTATQVCLVVGLIFLAFATLFATNVFPAAILGGIFNCCCIAIGAGLLSVIMGILLFKCNGNDKVAPPVPPRKRHFAPPPESPRSERSSPLGLDAGHDVKRRHRLDDKS